MSRLSKSSKSINEQYELAIDGQLYIINVKKKRKYHKEKNEIVEYEIERVIGSEEASNVIATFEKLKKQMEEK